MSPGGWCLSPCLSRLSFFIMSRRHRRPRDTSPSQPAVAALLALPGASERLQLFAADLLQLGSFDEAVAGCDVVIHTASPFALSVRAACARMDVVHACTGGMNVAALAVYLCVQCWGLLDSCNAKDGAAVRL